MARFLLPGFLLAAASLPFLLHCSVFSQNEEKSGGEGRSRRQAPPGFFLNPPIPTSIGHYVGTDQTLDSCMRDEVEVQPQGGCHRLLTQGPCNVTEMVLLDPETKEGFCAARLCSPDRIFVFSDQLCHDPRSNTLCPPGRQLYQTAYGTPVCQCPDGTYEGDDDLDDDVCEPILGQTLSCPPGQVLWFLSFSQPPQCLQDPCGGANLNRSPTDLPFVPSAADGRCYQLGQTTGVCPKETWYSLALEQLRGVCSSLEDAGYQVFDPETLDLINRIYGSPIAKNSNAGFTSLTPGSAGAGPSLSSPAGAGPSLSSPAGTSPSPSSPAGTSPSPSSPAGASPRLSSPAGAGPSLSSPAGAGPSLSSPAGASPSLSSPTGAGPSLSRSAGAGPSLSSPAAAGPSLSSPAGVGPSLSSPAGAGPSLSSPAGAGPSLSSPAGAGPGTSSPPLPITALSRAPGSGGSSRPALPGPDSRVTRPGGSVAGAPSSAGSIGQQGNLSSSPGSIVQEALGPPAGFLRPSDGSTGAQGSPDSLQSQGSFLPPSPGSSASSVGQKSPITPHGQGSFRSLNVINGQDFTRSPNNREFLGSSGTQGVSNPSAISEGSTLQGPSTISNGQSFSGTTAISGSSLASGSQSFPGTTSASGSSVASGSQSFPGTTSASAGQGLSGPSRASAGQHFPHPSRALPDQIVSGSSRAPAGQDFSGLSSVASGRESSNAVFGNGTQGTFRGQGSSTHTRGDSAIISHAGGSPFGTGRRPGFSVEQPNHPTSGTTSPGFVFSHEQQSRELFDGPELIVRDPALGFSRAASAHQTPAGRSLEAAPVSSIVKGDLVAGLTGVTGSGPPGGHDLSFLRAPKDHRLHGFMNGVRSIVGSLLQEEGQGRRRRRSPLPHATPANVFETRLVGCRAGAQRDINAKCRNTILPSRVPVGRATRAAPPVPPNPSCPPGQTFTRRRVCASQSEAINSINAYNLG